MKLFQLILFIALTAFGNKIMAQCNTPNLALNKPVSYSTQNPYEPATFAVDGNTGTKFRTELDGTQYIYVDLSQSYTLCEVKLTWPTLYYYAKDYKIQTSPDPNTNPWTDVATVTNNTGGIRTHAISGSARYVRVYMTAPGEVWAGRYELIEFEVYDASGGGNQPPVFGSGITAPANNSTYTAGSNIIFTSNPTDPESNPLTVTYYHGGTNVIGSSTAASNYSVTWSNVPAGNYSITAQASDGTNTRTSGAINITVNAPSGGGSSWLLGGNNTTINDFIGTLNDQPLIFKTFNAERMSIHGDASDTKLKIAGTLNHNISLDFSAGGTAYHKITSNANNGFLDIMAGAQGAGHSIRFFTNNVENMKLTPGGNLLLGTSTDNQNRLQVNGTAMFGQNDFSDPLGTYVRLFGHTNFSEINLRSQTGGDLTFYGNPQSYNQTGYTGKTLFGQSNGILSGGYVGTTNFNIGSYGSIIFRTGSPYNEVVRIANDGKFGIGISNPSALLHIAPSSMYTSINSTPAFLIHGSATGANIAMGVNGSGGTSNIIQSRDGSSSGWPISINPFGGNVGIGINNPSSVLHIKSAGSTAATDAMLVQNQLGNTMFNIKDDQTIEFRPNKLNQSSYIKSRAIDPDGRFAFDIGTGAAAYQLFSGFGDVIGFGPGNSSAEYATNSALWVRAGRTYIDKLTINPSQMSYGPSDVKGLNLTRNSIETYINGTVTGDVRDGLTISGRSVFFNIGDLGTNVMSINPSGVIQFQNLTNNNSLDRVLVTDINGNLSYRTAGSLGGGGGPAGNLQNVTDNGPTTTNNITTGNITIDKTTQPSLLFAKSGIQKAGLLYDDASGGLNYYSNVASASHFFIKDNGNVTIGGTTDNGRKLQVNGTSYFSDHIALGTNVVTAGFKMEVKGKIRAMGVRVQTDPSTWPDYVFKSNYQLLSLAQVEKFIQQNGHLPEVPSAAEVEKNGLDLGDNQAILLKKIEELTLYLIDQNKRLDEQNKKLDQQQKEIELLKKQQEKAGNK